MEAEPLQVSLRRKSRLAYQEKTVKHEALQSPSPSELRVFELERRSHLRDDNAHDVWRQPLLPQRV